MGLKNPVPQFSYLLEQLKAKHPDLAYIHTVTATAPLNAPSEDPSVRTHPISSWSSSSFGTSHLPLAGPRSSFVPLCLTTQVDPDFVYKLWTPGTVVVAGGFDRESALKVAEETEQLVAFGRPFLANVSVSPLSPPRPPSQDLHLFPRLRTSPRC